MVKSSFLLLLGLFLLSCQPQKTDQKVAEKSLIDLGGEKQYVEITGNSSKNPVMLFIHGGPGWPQTPQLRYFNADLTKDFILATWDQRGSGLSYQHNPKAQNLSLEQTIQDAHQLTQLLKKQFKQEKIYLVGYSWGSMVGLLLAERYPEDYHAYVGVAQVINMRRGIEVSRKWLTEQASAAKDQETLAALKQLNDQKFCNSDMQCFIKQYELIEKYHGATHNPSNVKEVEKAMTQYADYQKYDWLKGFEFSAQRLGKDMFATNLENMVQLKIPAYFLLGRHDWNVPAVLVEEYFSKLKAPKKEIVWFENSGHGPLEEEADQFNAALKNLLK